MGGGEEVYVGVDDGDGHCSFCPLGLYLELVYFLGFFSSCKQLTLRISVELANAGLRDGGMGTRYSLLQLFLVS